MRMERISLVERVGVSVGKKRKSERRRRRRRRNERILFACLLLGIELSQRVGMSLSVVGSGSSEVSLCNSSRSLNVVDSSESSSNCSSEVKAEKKGSDQTSEDILLEVGRDLYVYEPEELSKESGLVELKRRTMAAGWNQELEEGESFEVAFEGAKETEWLDLGGGNTNTDASTSTNTNSSSNSSSVPREETNLEKTDQVTSTQNSWFAQNNSRSSVSSSTFCIGTKDSSRSFNWICKGIRLLSLPTDLRPNPMSLRLSNTGIELLAKSSLSVYKETLRDFSIEGAPKLLAIEAGAFEELIRLRVLFIVQAPKLLSLDLALSGFHPNLTIINVQQTALSHWPDLVNFRQERILTSLDLDNNKIATLGSKPINFRTGLLNLEFNYITTIEEFTFNGSEIGALSLKGNLQLASIHENAFANLKNLFKLDLSSTSIHQLPTVGLHQLRALIIKDTYALKRIPSVYVFPMLETAELTYAYHCCSFRYPKSHDPVAYQEHLELQENLNRLCASRKLDSQASDIDNQQHLEPIERKFTTPSVDPTTSTMATFRLSQTSTGTSEWEGVFEHEEQQRPPNGVSSNESSRNTSDSNSSVQSELLQAGQRGVNNNPKSPKSNRKGAPDQELKKLWLLHNIECGELASSVPNISCSPEPDAFNPCEDIMGYAILRFAVWLVVGCSVSGNFAVIVVQMGVFRRMSVPKLLQLNLAIGDLFMGVYLMMLALADLTTAGTYFNYAIDWQHGFGCKIAGASSLFASQLSIFTLSVLTFERFYTITYSIDLNMRLQLGWASRIMLFGWLYAFGSAMLPIFADINSYSKTSICIPMRTTHLLDRLYIFILLFIDSSAFVIILLCYLRMYLLIVSQKTEASAKERTVAMRMALLVFTDFACWAPIIFFGLTALFGKPLISVTNSKILVVLFYPLNSMANPYLYVLCTRQYKRDLQYLSSRWRTWRRNLFKSADERFYGTNMVHLSSQANLQAVAAITGTADHLRHKQIGYIKTRNPTFRWPPNSQQSGSQNRNSSQTTRASVVVQDQHHQQQQQKQHQRNQRVICSKAQQGSQYIIRHQILTDKHRAWNEANKQQQQQRMLHHFNLVECSPKSSGDEKQLDCHPKGDASENVIPTAKTCCGKKVLSESGTVNMIECNSELRSRVKCNRLSKCCCRKCCSNSSCCCGRKRTTFLSPSSSTSNNQRKLCRKGGNSSKCSTLAPPNANCKSITLSTTLPAELQPNALNIEPQGGATRDKIDILGNLSYNEPTSSFSNRSSPGQSATLSGQADGSLGYPSRGRRKKAAEHSQCSDCCSPNHKASVSNGTERTRPKVEEEKKKCAEEARGVRNELTVTSDSTNPTSGELTQEQEAREKCHSRCSNHHHHHHHHRHHHHHHHKRHHRHHRHKLSHHHHHRHHHRRKSAESKPNNRELNCGPERGGRTN